MPLPLESCAHAGDWPVTALAPSSTRVAARIMAVGRWQPSTTLNRCGCCFSSLANAETLTPARQHTNFGLRGENVFWAKFGHLAKDTHNLSSSFFIAALDQAHKLLQHLADTHNLS